MYSSEAARRQGSPGGGGACQPQVSKVRCRAECRAAPLCRLRPPPAALTLPGCVRGGAGQGGRAPGLLVDVGEQVCRPVEAEVEAVRTHGDVVRVLVVGRRVLRGRAAEGGAGASVSASRGALTKNSGINACSTAMHSEDRRATAAASDLSVVEEHARVGDDGLVVRDRVRVAHAHQRQLHGRGWRQPARRRRCRPLHAHPERRKEWSECEAHRAEPHLSGRLKASLLELHVCSGAPSNSHQRCRRVGLDVGAQRLEQARYQRGVRPVPALCLVGVQLQHRGRPQRRPRRGRILAAAQAGGGGEEAGSQSDSWQPANPALPRRL